MSLRDRFDADDAALRSPDNPNVCTCGSLVLDKVSGASSSGSGFSFRSDVQVEPPEEVPDNSEFITSVDTRKVESEFAVRNVTELIVDDGQQADKGRKMRLNDVDGFVRGAKSAGRIERLLRNKRSFSELWNQKGECAIPCDKQLCSFATLSEQESGQTRQMDRGETEVEEERRVRTKCVPVLTADSEKHGSKNTHVASRSQCKTEDSRKHLETESSLPRMTIWSRVQC